MGYHARGGEGRTRLRPGRVQHLAGWRRHQGRRDLRRHRRPRLGGRGDPVHIHDLHATILYLMGIDHEKRIYSYSGREFRLMDVAGEVIHDIIA